ncbi:hypothetical protein KIN20_031188 [Parelaphostrongylus tenuis]|uniref:C3H1-type domain-containing protein n=1 Tax=Parelaphostrongylus tenuis TaxID=148309 RepID=A0AAD5R6G1_PARTN|nr:hypothetical protein KIN20_031188 [Parelaphostrongylus tenuis]
MDETRVRSPPAAVFFACHSVLLGSIFTIFVPVWYKTSLQQSLHLFLQLDNTNYFVLVAEKRRKLSWDVILSQAKYCSFITVNPSLLSDSLIWDIDKHPCSPAPSSDSVDTTYLFQTPVVSCIPSLLSNYPKYAKTVLCDVWKRGERCKYGQYCWYAHGSLQLRSIVNEIPDHLEVARNCEEQIAQSITLKLTPEQRQWIVLSQYTRINVDNLLNALSHTLLENADSSAHARSEVERFGLLCEQLEREQMAIYSSNETAQSTPALSSSVPIKQLDISSLQPSTPIIRGSLFSLSLKGIINEALSYLSNSSRSTKMNVKIQKFFIPFEKEECNLNKYSQCPFGNNCFFEHLPNDVEHDIAVFYS